VNPLRSALAASHVPVELDPGLGPDVASRDRDGLDIDLGTGLRHIDGVLHEDHRVVVGEGDAAAAERHGRQGQVFRAGRIGQRVDLPGLGDDPVWQKRQARLQPAVPNDSTALPGRKWLSGFFSIGSTQKPLERP
jgi:hypothetical protein